MKNLEMLRPAVSAKKPLLPGKKRAKAEKLPHTPGNLPFMTKLLFIIIPALVLIITGCASTPSIDEIIEWVSWETVELLPAEDGLTVVVYYFTLDGEKTYLSDYFINGLTTQVANAINEEEKEIRIVSRKNLDRITEELSFQLSGLSDQETQVAVGKQLGADIILTGTITSLDDLYKLNAQLVEVESGVVLGGFIYEFWVDEDMDL